MPAASFTKEWKDIKASFEVATKRKKPSEKLLGLFRKGTGLESAFATLDRAIGSDDLDEAKKAYATAKKAADAYQRTLIKAAMAEKDKEVQKDTSNMMVELFKLVESAETAMKKTGQIADINSLSDFAKLMKTKAGNRLAEGARKEYNEEALLFLEAMVKKNYFTKTYNDFIAENGKNQVNIPGRLRTEFETAFEKDNLKSAPWAEAVHEVLLLINNDVIPRINRTAGDS